jgi:hypothetical protein
VGGLIWRRDLIGHELLEVWRDSELKAMKRVAYSRPSVANAHHEDTKGTKVNPLIIVFLGVLSVLVVWNSNFQFRASNLGPRLPLTAPAQESWPGRQNWYRRLFP